MVAVDKRTLKSFLVDTEPIAKTRMYAVATVSGSSLPKEWVADLFRVR